MRFIPYSDIRDKLVPSVEDFDRIIDLARAAIDQNEYVSWAILAGSAVRHMLSPASDIDLVVCLGKGLRSFEIVEALAQISAISADAAEHGVPFEPHVVTEDELEAGLHTLRHGYARHLNWAIAKGGLIKGSIDCVPGLPGNSRDDLIGYVARKIDKARGNFIRQRGSGIGIRGDSWYDWLGDILSVHRHVLFRFQDMYDMHDCFDPDVLLRDTGAIEDFLHLDAMRLEYAVCLGQQLTNPNPAVWYEVETRVADCGIVLLSFLGSIENYLVRTAPAPI
ncbi:MAG: hypothetical protein WCT32_05120 [Patescibacteria group bacterium]|jgi:predicted nucleotidyltransferase